MTTKNKTTTTNKTITLTGEEVRAIIAAKDNAALAAKREEISAYIEELQTIAGDLRKNFDRVLEVAKGMGVGADIAPLRKPRDKSDKSDPLSFLD